MTDPHEPIQRDWLHWLRHRWSKWTPPRSATYIGDGIMNKGEKYFRFVQDRHCLTCNAHDIRIINPDNTL